MLKRINMFFLDCQYYYQNFCIDLMSKLRTMMGHINGLKIDNNKSHGVVKIHKWQLRLFKCVTASDVYILTGMWDKLICPKIAYGYPYFGMSENLYEDIGDILEKHYKWNRQTRYRNDDGFAIRFDWMNYAPITVDCGKKNVIVWSTDDIRYLCKKIDNKYVLDWDLVK